MTTWAENWVEEEYLRLIILADQLLGKEKLVDFYHGKYSPAREQNTLYVEKLIPFLEELLKVGQNQLTDNPPFYYKTFFLQQINAFKILLESGTLQPAEGQTLPDYIQLVEALLGTKLNEPDWQADRRRLHKSLEAAGYCGSLEEMFKEWQQEGNVDVFTFIKTADNMLFDLWEETRSKLLQSILSPEDIDFLQARSQIKLFHLNNVWEDWPYYGGYRSVYLTMIALNARVRWNRFGVRAFMSHEAIPGRHLFWLLRQRLYDTGQASHITMLSTFGSPERVIQEGFVACANEFLWPNGAEDAKEQIAFDHWRLQRTIGLQAAIDLYHKNEPEKQVQTFIEEQALVLPGKAKALLEIIKENPYHYPAAQLGYELVKGFWQTHGVDFLQELSLPRNPAVLYEIYPLPN